MCLQSNLKPPIIKGYNVDFMCGLVVRGHSSQFAPLFLLFLLLLLFVLFPLALLFLALLFPLWFGISKRVLCFVVCKPILHLGISKHVLRLVSCLLNMPLSENDSRLMFYSTGRHT